MVLYKKGVPGVHVAAATYLLSTAVSLPLRILINAISDKQPMLIKLSKNVIKVIE